MAGSGYGSSGWGAGPWGDGKEFIPTTLFNVVVDDIITTVTDSVEVTKEGLFEVAISDSILITDFVKFPLSVAAAISTNPLHVRVDFSEPLNISYPPLLDPANYSIPGLTVTAAVIFSATQVLLTTTSQLQILYTVTVAQAQDAFGEPLGFDKSASFFGFAPSPTFFAGAQSSTKVELVFSTPMTVNPAFLTPSNYTITWTEGGAPVPVASVVASGPSPIQRATLILGAPLKSKEYYAITVSPLVTNSSGLAVFPDSNVFQWGDMTRPLQGAPLEIPIADFSGETSGGILGNPAGQVFFSPALETVTADSTIELEEVSVCTRAFDIYSFPNPPDPIPLFTFGGPVPTVIGGNGNVLWAPAERLGQARLNLADHPRDTANQPFDGPANAVLVETIDITRAGFLNDTRWKTYPATAATVFITADNLTPIGPGPTQNIQLQPYYPEVYDALAAQDEVVALVNFVDLFSNDTLALADTVTLQIL